MTGLHYFKIDLHTHTPASNCYSNKTHTAAEIVEEAIQNGLDGIAVTDHNSGLWIDEMVKAAENTSLTIIPGVEISLAAGYHIIALFELGTSREQIENFLGAIDIISDDYGKPNAVCDLSPADVVGKIHNRNGLMILAHIDDERGAFKHLAEYDSSTGDLVRVPNECALLLSDLEYDAVECVAKSLPHGFDSDHGIRRIPPFYQSSDNPDPNDQRKHSLEGIGSRHTYFKMETINLEGLRQCFIDPEVRLCLPDDYQEYQYPRINSISIGEGGFFRNPEISFHSGLNSIIGGKGVGKSVLMEFIRFALDQSSSDSDLFKDHLGKLEKRLTRGNHVTISYVTDSNEEFLISREYRGVRSTDSGPVLIGSPEIIRQKSGREFKGRVQEFFPILAYSQTEVIKISEDKNAQLDLIDKFIDKNSFIARIANIESLLRENDQKLSVSIDAQARLGAVQDDISGLTEKIRLINRTLSDPIFDAAQIAEGKWGTFNRHIQFLDDLSIKISDLRAEIGNKRLVSIPETLKNDDAIKGVKAVISSRKTSLAASLQEIDLEIQGDREKIVSERDVWRPEYDKILGEYTKFLESSGGDGQEQEDARQDFQEKLDGIKREAAGYRRKIGKLDELRNGRNELLDQLEKAHSGYYTRREEVFTRITELSNEKVQLTIEHALDKSRFSSTIVDTLKGGNNAPQVSMRRRLADKLTPRRLVDIIIDRDVQALENEAEISGLWAGRIIEKLWSLDEFTLVLSIQYTNYPSDVPFIKFRKPSGQYEEISDLSVGQKCTALVIIALCDGSMPVIIDQPEDALDIVSVWEDVAQKLRMGKEMRQFILTTHNSSIAVSADSDQFIVLEEAGGDHGKVLSIGAIDNPSVKDEVMKRLEGGEVPYDLRARKYNQSTHRK